VEFIEEQITMDIQGEEKLQIEKEEQGNQVEHIQHIEDNEDDVTNLKIPEIIWQRALCSVNEAEIQNYNFKFLSALMKNSKNLHYKRLKQILIDSIMNTTQNTPLLTSIKIMNCKLEKYEEKDFFKKAIDKYSKFLSANLPDDCNTNFVISNLVEVLKNKISEFHIDNDNENHKDTDKKDKLNEYIIKSLSSKINQEDLVENYNAKHNLLISRYIYEESYYTANKFKNELKLDEIISRIIETIPIQIEVDETSICNQYFEIYWKYSSLNLRNDAETIIEKLSLIFTSKTNSSKNSITKVFINNMILLVQEEIKIFSDKSLSLVGKIIEIIKKLKILDQTLLKDLFKNLTESLYVNKLFKMIFIDIFK